MYGYLISFWLYFLSHVKEDPNTNEGKLPRHPKDRNELQKQVLLLYLVLLRNLMETEWRSKALGKVVSEPPEELAPECKANVVHLQQDNQTGMCSYINYTDWICECVHFFVYTLVFMHINVCRNFCHLLEN